jgi:hypothetical protein
MCARRDSARFKIKSRAKVPRAEPLGEASATCAAERSEAIKESAPFDFAQGRLRRGIDAERFSYPPSKALFYHSPRASRRIPALFRPSFTLRSNPATAGSSTRLTFCACKKRTGILRDERVE